MIVGVGVDLVDVARFATSLERTPGLGDRLFTAAESSLQIASLAARFAAKEALVKAVGPLGDWHDAWVETEDGVPRLRFSQAAQRILDERGVTAVHLSLSHDGGSAIAFVVAESTPH